MRRGSCQTLLFVVVAGIVCLPVSGTASVGALFDLGASARVQGMGGVGLALASGVDAVQYNPAALEKISTWSLSSMYVAHFGGVSFGTIGVGGPHVGVQLFFLDSGLIGDPDEQLRYAAQGAMISWGVAIVPGTVAAGVRARAARITRPSISWGWAVDPCLLIELGSWRAGLLIEAMASGGTAEQRAVEDAWRRHVLAGVAYDLHLQPSFDLALAGELRDAFSPDREVAVGAELRMDSLWGRVGWDATGLAIGVSVEFGWIRVDWSNVFSRNLGSSFRVGIVTDLHALWMTVAEGGR